MVNITYLCAFMDGFLHCSCCLQLLSVDEDLCFIFSHLRVLLYFLSAGSTSSVLFFALSSLVEEMHPAANLLPGYFYVATFLTDNPV